MTPVALTATAAPHQAALPLHVAALVAVAVAPTAVAPAAAAAAPSQTVKAPTSQACPPRVHRIKVIISLVIVIRRSPSRDTSQRLGEG